MAAKEKKTGIVFADGAGHDLLGHTEHRGRTEAIWNCLTESGILDHVVHLPARLANDEELRRVHSAEHIAHIAHQSRHGGGQFDSDTYCTPESYTAASRAAGSCCALVDALLHKEVHNGFAIVRPPGHHASVSEIEGFCLFNNIAVAVRHAQKKYGVERVVVLDFDVHHGNGTQAIFYNDPTVLFISVHQYAPFFYPQTGHSQEAGHEKGYGHTINLPLPHMVGDLGYQRLFDQLLEPIVEGFQPKMIFVSAGFDAHWRDPLADELLSLTGYAHLVHTLKKWADLWCQGRILFALEGGYDLEVVSYGVLNTLYALLGENSVVDPIGRSPLAERDITDVLTHLQDYHLLGF